MGGTDCCVWSYSQCHWLPDEWAGKEDKSIKGEAWFFFLTEVTGRIKVLFTRLVGGPRVVDVGGGRQGEEMDVYGKKGARNLVLLQVRWPFSFYGGTSLLMRTLLS